MRWPFRFLLYIPIIALASRLIYFYHWLSERKNPRTDRRGQIIRSLKTLVTLPIGLDKNAKAVIRHKLAHLYFVDRQYEKAIEQDRILLATGLSGGIATVVRRRLANCLEALGKNSEAASERDRAVQATEALPENAQAQFTRGKLLAEKNHHSEACAAYGDALSLVAPREIELRFQILGNLVISSFKSGQPKETIAWAEKLIQFATSNSYIRSAYEMSGLDYDSVKEIEHAESYYQMMHKGQSALYLRTAYRMSGLAYSNLGDLEQAEKFYLLCLELPNDTEKPEKVAENLASLAGIQKNIGRLDEALGTCEQALAMAPDKGRVAAIHLQEIYKLLGRFEDTRDVILKAQQSQPYFTPSHEAHSQAALKLALANTEIELGNPIGAWNLYLEAAPSFHKDVKMGLYLDALAAWINAELGHISEAKRLILKVEAESEKALESRTTQLDAFGMLTRAALSIGDYENALRFCERVLELQPYPAYQPRAYYYLGECRRNLGNLESAKRSYQAALDVNIDTIHARQAQERLDEIAGKENLP